MQQLQDSDQSNVDNPSSVRREASKPFRSKTKVYLKAKIYELETNSKIKNIRDLYIWASLTLGRVTSLELM
jgi:hypothetical protein